MLDVDDLLVHVDLTEILTGEALYALVSFTFTGLLLVLRSRKQWELSVDAQNQQAESLEGADERSVVGNLGLVFLRRLSLLHLTDLRKDAEIEVHCHLA